MSPCYLPSRNSHMMIYSSKTASCCNDISLSPLGEAELVKPAANLSFQPCTNHSSKADSMNALNTQDKLPMYVVEPKMIASDSARRALMRASAQRPSVTCSG